MFSPYFLRLSLREREARTFDEYKLGAHAAFNRLRGAGKLLGGARNSATKLATTDDNDGAPFHRKLYNSRIGGTNGERIENAFKDHHVLCALLYNSKGLSIKAPKCNI